MIVRCKLVRVKSTSIVAMGYDAGQSLLVVIYHGGATWAYQGVEPERWRGLVRAESKGRYLRSEVLMWRRGIKIDPVTIVQPEEE